VDTLGYEVALLVLPPPHRGLNRSRGRALLLVAAVFTFFFSSYVFTASGDIFSQGDTAIRVQIAENILGRFSVELHGWNLEYAPHTKKEYVDPRVSLGRGRATFSTYLLGQPLAILPFEKVGSAIAVQEHWPYGPAVVWFDRLVGPLFGALEVTIFFLFAVRLGWSLRRSLLLTGIFGFATSVWPDEQSVLEHTEVAFFMLLAMYFAFRSRQQSKGAFWMVWSGMALGGAAITRYQDAFIGGLAIGLYVLLASGRRRFWISRLTALGAFFVGVAPFLALDLWYSWYRFGSPLATGHYEKLFGYPPQKGIPGLLISPGKGLLWYCPVIFLLVFAGPMFARRYPALLTSFAAVVAGMVILYANVTFWHGDPAWGPRYLYPAVPFLILPIGMLPDVRTRFRSPMLAISALVIAASLTIQVAGVSVSQWRSWYRVISYEENQGHPWDWIASRYRYFWNPHESPLNFQVHGLYQLTYDTVFHSHKYELVPPAEDPILDSMTTDYAVNQWNFWWTTNEFNWWMGERKIILGVVMLLATIISSGAYLAAEASDLFEPPAARETRNQPIPEAA